jgi:hypothetical protein
MGIVLFGSFRPFVAFATMHNNVQLSIDTGEDLKMYMGKFGMDGDSVKIVALS